MSHHVSFNDLPQGGEKFEPAKGGKLIGALGLVGVLGLAASAFFFFKNTDTFAYSWLFAIFFTFTFCVGGVFWIMLHAASNSSWGVAIRRLWENLANMVVILGLLASPLLIPAVNKHLYEWMNHHREAAHHAAEHGGTVQEALHHMSHDNPHLHILYSKFGYLNISNHFIPPFSWQTRFVLYFLILGYIARVMRKKSLAQEQDGDIKHTISSRQFSCRWLLFFALTSTFAAVDWLMSLDYSWFSTMWGVYIFAGSAWSSMALTILLVTWLKSLGYLQKVVTQEHYHLMGKLLFAFTVFWAYIAFSQYFLIWYANITEETRFYLTRNTEGWRGVSIFIVVGHFIAPFLALLSQARKKKPTSWSSSASGSSSCTSWTCTGTSSLSVALPSASAGGWTEPGSRTSPLSAPSSGTMGFLFLRGLSKYSLYPWRDPRLIESVNVIN
jgi:hypothetical protein